MTDELLLEQEIVLAKSEYKTRFHICKLYTISLLLLLSTFIFVANFTVPVSCHSINGFVLMHPSSEWIRALSVYRKLFSM